MTGYAALYESLRSRKSRSRVPSGLDRLAVRIAVARDEARLRPARVLARARAIAALSPGYKKMSDGALDHTLAEMRDVFLRGRQTPEHVDNALAMVRDLARRETGEEPFPVQIMAALSLYHGRIVEMLTGEGKTLTGSLAAPLIAWRRRRLHVLTVNDYLAQRDAESRRPIFRRCGLRVGAVVQETPPQERFDLYAREIVYTTPKQVVADWLRDQLRLGRAATPWAARALAAMRPGADGEQGVMPMVPGLHAALVDEADAVLIDEGVVPLIIARSRREDDMAQVYKEACAVAPRLDEGPDYEVDYLRRRVKLKPRGEHRLRGFLDELLAAGGQPIWRAKKRAEELITQALVARHCYIGGQQYQVVDGKVVIVDEYTGRFLQDRSWEHGLHQSVEAKEGVEVTADRETLARLSFQRFFRTYPFLCGMTGTAADATPEIKATYRRAVMRVPTNRPLIREQWPTRVFRSQRDKWGAVVDSIALLRGRGRPVLVGTRSIASSEHLSKLLEARRIPHQVLNANHDKEEAEVIVRAGKGGPDASVTVATNMAGRGTDIKLDKAAREAGGLHVVLTEMHGALRIDRQFIGRAGRQGDPGSAQVFVSLDDELFAKHAKWVARLGRGRLRRTELTGLPGADAVLRLVQRRSEALARRNRAAVLAQDEWIDKHLPGMG